MRTPKHPRRLLWLAPLALTAIDCRSATQLTLEITTDFPCAKSDDAPQAGVSTVETQITIGRLGAELGSKSPVTATTQCKDQRIGALVVVPSGDKGDEVAVQIVTSVDQQLGDCASHPENCITARRSIHYMPHGDVSLPIVMRASCRGKPCDPSSTCVNGSCVSARCATATCTEESLGAVKEPDPATDASIADSEPRTDGSTGSDADVVRDAGPLDDAARDAGDAAVLDATADATIDAAVPVLQGSIFAGSLHTCALQNQTLKCWGDNTSGQLGIGTQTPTAFAVTSYTGATKFAVRGRHTCALKDTGVIECWGNNQANQIDPSGSQQYPAPSPLTPLADVTSLAAGMNATCALIDGGATCWGTLYNTTPSGRAPIPSLVDATHVVWGRYHACARLTDGGISCWGENASGKVGINDPTSGFRAVTPVSVAAGVTVTHLALGENHACAVGSDGFVYCWGDNSSQGVLGSGSGAVLKPTKVVGVSGASMVGVGATHSCALVSGGVWCWGTNTNGESGRSNANAFPQQVAGLSGVTEIAIGRTFSCSLGSNVQCWGDNSANQLARPGNVNSSTPVVVTLP